MKYNFKRNVLDILINSGWKETRRVDKIELRNKIIDSGYPILLRVVEFLEEFDGLFIKFVNLKNKNEDNICLDFSKAFELEGLERVLEDYQPRIKKKLCIIGTAYNDYFVLIMDEDGCVYGAYDSLLVKISESGESAIEAIIDNRNFVKIE